MSTPKTHWKKLTNPDYIGAYAMEEGKDLTVTVTKVCREMVTGNNGKKEECTVAHLSGGHKPMILNATNCKTITAMHKTPFIEEWAGKPITLYVTTTKMAGETVECLRIRNTNPNLPELTPSGPKWVGACEALRSGQFLLKDIESKYIISDDNRERLISESI